MASLTAGSTPQPPPPPPPHAPMTHLTPPPAAATATTEDRDTTGGDGGTYFGGFPYATASYFGLDKLESKGPRAKVDWGIPVDATRKLSDDGTLRVGSWYCSEGGWPSPNPKAHTEIFYVLDGYGSLDDEDGVRHYFGPGDNVIIPKGHTGRWDVNKAIHKVWAVNAHLNIEERNVPIRVQVDHYNSWAPHQLFRNVGGGNDPLYGWINDDNGVRTGYSNTLSKTFYNVGPTQVGVWCSPIAPVSFPVTNGKRAWIYILEGIIILSNGVDGTARRCGPGDTIVVPDGWYGHVDVIEPVKKLWTVVE